MSNPNDVRLLVNGQAHGGWKSVRISAGIERQSRDFDLTVTDTWPSTDKSATSVVSRRIRPGDECQVFIGNDLVLTGYVDATPIKYDGTQISVSVQGRSKTADLVDCCPVQSLQATADSGGGGNWADVKTVDDNKQAPVKPAPRSSQFTNQKLEAIAAALAQPYGVKVIAETDTGKVIPNHQIQQGETVFESIDRMMRLRHVLSTDNASGDLVLIEVGAGGRAGTALVCGENVLAADAGLDYKDVYSEYVCKGQRKGNDEEFGAAVSEESASSDDDDWSGDDAPGETLTTTGHYSDDFSPKRRRLLVLKQSGQADEGTLADRVRYERAHRAAKALQTSYTVASWRQKDGSLWLMNQLVRVVDPIIGFDFTMLIAEVSYIMDEKGQRVVLKVGPPGGYVTQAAQETKAKAKGGKGSNWGDVK